MKNLLLLDAGLCILTRTHQVAAQNTPNPGYRAAMQNLAQGQIDAAISILDSLILADAENEQI